MVLEVREVFLNILVSHTAVMSKSLPNHFNKYIRSSKFLFKERALIWNKDIGQEDIGFDIGHYQSI